jgi:hypothetical protein
MRGTSRIRLATNRLVLDEKQYVCRAQDAVTNPILVAVEFCRSPKSAKPPRKITLT